MIVAAALSGCESDVEKLQRLRTDEVITEGNVAAMERRLDSLREATGEAYHPVFDTLQEKRAELDLIRADIARLLR